MASEMDLGFYFHHGRHDFGGCIGENMAASPLNRISRRSQGRMADIIKLLLGSVRDLCLSGLMNRMCVHVRHDAINWTMAE